MAAPIASSQPRPVFCLQPAGASFLCICAFVNEPWRPPLFLGRGPAVWRGEVCSLPACLPRQTRVYEHLQAFCNFGNVACMLYKVTLGKGECLSRPSVHCHPCFTTPACVPTDAGVFSCVYHCVLSVHCVVQHAHAKRTSVAPHCTFLQSGMPLCLGRGQAGRQAGRVAPCPPARLPTPRWF